MQLKTTDQLSHILHDKIILKYADFINGQYIFPLKNNLEPPVIVNLADIKREIKSIDIKLWHLFIEHLGYRSLRTFKNFNS